MRRPASNMHVGGRDVPVLDVRDPDHRIEIARQLARGRPAAFYIGMFTIMRVIGPPWRDRGESSTFWTVKRNRPAWSKLPVFLRPSRALRLADFRAVHPAFRGLRRREAFEALWSHGAPMHVVVPVRDRLRYVPPAIVTSPDDLTSSSRAVPMTADRRVGQPTASMFWMADPAWEDLAVRLEVACPPRSWMVGSSFNDHGQAPPFTLGELPAHCERRSDLPFDLVVTDELLESCRGFSSHSLVRVPLVGEEPALVMLRRGSVSAEWLQETTGHEVRVLASATEASRPAGTTDRDLRSAFETLARRRVDERAGQG